MKEETQKTNPKLIVAVQMLCIGVVLVVLGIAVALMSPIMAMTPTFRFWSIVSNASIVLTGIAFTIGGLLRYKKRGT